MQENPLVHSKLIFALCQSEVVDKTEVKMLTLNCMTLFTNEKYNILLRSTVCLTDSNG